MSTKPRLDLDELERKNSVNYKYCEHCGHPIPRSSEFACCQSCQDTILFHAVKNYIREKRGTVDFQNSLENTSKIELCNFLLNL